jgi:uncharacterized protein (TIRG00374 family)
MVSTRHPKPGDPAIKDSELPPLRARPFWKTWRFWLQWGLTAAMVTVIAVSVDLGEAANVVRELQPGWLILGVALLVVSNYLHAVKWQRLLATVGHAPLRDLFAVFWSSMATNNVIPFRAGDVLRVQVLANRCRLPRGGIVASLLTERVLDGVSFVLILACGLVLLSGGGAEFYVVSVVLAAVVGAALLGIALLARIEVRPDFDEQRLLGRLPPRLRRSLSGVLPDFLDGLKALAQPRSALESGAWALAAWMLEVGAYAAFGLALGLDIGPGGYFLVMVAVNFAGSLTILPSNLGIYEFAAISILQATGASAGEATAYAFGSHLIVILTISGVGILTLAYLRIGPHDLLYFRRQPSAEEVGRTSPE